MEEILVRDILQELNKLVAPIGKRRINDFSKDLHEPIKKLVDPYLNTLGLECGTWKVIVKFKEDVPNDLYHIDLFRYLHLNFKPDKRYSFKTTGNIDGIKFSVLKLIDHSIESNLHENLTLTEYKHQYATKLKELSIERWKNIVDKSLADLTKNIECLHETIFKQIKY